MAEWFIEIANTRSNKTYRAPLAGDIALTYRRKEDPSKMEFEVVNVGELNFQCGNPVVLFCDGKAVFKGYIFKKTRENRRRIKCLAYDQLRYLKYKGTLQYQDRATDELIAMIARDRGLLVGTLEPTGIKMSRNEENSEFFTMINNSLESTLIESGRYFVFYDDVGRLTLKEAKNMMFRKFVFNERNIGSWDYGVTIDNGTYNVLDILVKDEAWGGEKGMRHPDRQAVKEWGMLQFHAVTNEDFARVSERTRKLLPLVSRPVRSLKLKDCRGDISIRGGSLVAVSLNLGDMVVNAWFMVDSVTHKIRGNKHTMDMEVINDKFMPATDISGAYSDKKDTKGQSATETTGDEIHGSSKIPETSNAAKAWNILRGRGYSAAAAAGILGNLDAESGVNPTILQNGRGPGTGIAQWENPGRWPILLRWARNSNKNPWAVETQVEFILYDLEGGEATTEAIINNRYGGLAKFKQSKNVKWATDAFYNSFERGSIHRMEVRYASANKFYSQWANHQFSAPTTSTTGSYAPYNWVEDPNNKGAPGNCTWYMYNRYYQLTKKSIGLPMGHGGEWANNARTYGMTVVKGKPFVGAAMCQQKGTKFVVPLNGRYYGHISFVEKVNKDGTVEATSMWGGDNRIHPEHHLAGHVAQNEFIDVMGWLKSHR